MKKQKEDFIAKVSEDYPVYKEKLSISWMKTRKKTNTDMMRADRNLPKHLMP